MNLNRREFVASIIAALAAANRPAPGGPDPSADPQFYFDAEAFDREHGHKVIFDLLYHDADGSCRYQMHVTEDMAACLVREWHGHPAGPYIFLDAA